jgi:hypothetical protein
LVRVKPATSRMMGAWRVMWAFVGISFQNVVEDFIARTQLVDWQNG